MKYKYPYFTLTYDVYTYTGTIYITRRDFDGGLEVYYTQYYKQNKQHLHLRLQHKCTQQQQQQQEPQQNAYNEHIKAEPTGVDASTSVGREGHQDRVHVRSPSPSHTGDDDLMGVHADEEYVKHT